MSYPSTNQLLNFPLSYVYSNWDGDKNFLKSQIFARGARLILTPASLITRAVDTIIGLGLALGAISTVGKNETINKAAKYYISTSAGLLAQPYMIFLRSINPKVQYYERVKSEKPHTGNGYLRELVINPINNFAIECYASDNFLKRQVVSRLTYPLLALSCLVSRAVDGIIAIPTAALSILTLGKITPLNTLARIGLEASDIISDLFYCAMKIVNPGSLNMDL